jgi:hypothetical protein
LTGKIWARISVVLRRRPKLTGHQRREAIARRKAGDMLTDIARSYNVSHNQSTALSAGFGLCELSMPGRFFKPVNPKAKSKPSIPVAFRDPKNLKKNRKIEGRDQ